MELLIRFESAESPQNGFHGETAMSTGPSNEDLLAGGLEKLKFSQGRDPQGGIGRLQPSGSSR